MSNQCICKTLKGSRCKNSVIEGTDTCAKHAKKCDEFVSVKLTKPKVVKKTSVKKVTAKAPKKVAPKKATPKKIVKTKTPKAQAPKLKIGKFTVEGTKKEFQEMCREKGLSDEGTKDELIRRLQKFIDAEAKSKKETTFSDEEVIKNIPKWLAPLAKKKVDNLTISDLIDYLEIIEEKCAGNIPKIYFYGEEEFTSKFVEEVGHLKAGFIANSMFGGILGSVIVECIKEGTLKKHIKQFHMVENGDNPIDFLLYLDMMYDTFTTSFNLGDTFTSIVAHRVVDSSGLHYERHEVKASLNDVDAWDLDRVKKLHKKHTTPKKKIGAIKPDVLSSFGVENIELLPCDMLLKIANNLPPEDYGKLSVTSKKFNQCLNEGRAGEDTNLRLMKQKKKDYYANKIENMINAANETVQRENRDLLIANQPLKFKIIDNGFEAFDVRIVRRDKDILVDVTVNLDDENEDVGFVPRYKHLFRLGEVDSIWLGCGHYGKPGPEDVGNSILVVKGDVCTHIGPTISEFKLRKGEYITNFISTLGNSAVVYGYIQSNLGFYGLHSFTCETGYIPLKEMPKDADLICWDDDYPFVPIPSYKVLVKRGEKEFLTKSSKKIPKKTKSIKKTKGVKKVIKKPVKKTKKSAK